MQRVQARQMLRTIRDAIRKDYYDPAFHGLDEEHFKAAEKKIDTVESMGRAYTVIAQALIDLSDSHTYFLPPQVSAQFEYGWQMAIVGDRCLVLGVKPGSDAETKGCGRAIAFSRSRPCRRREPTSGRCGIRCTC